VRTGAGQHGDLQKDFATIGYLNRIFLIAWKFRLAINASKLERKNSGKEEKSALVFLA